MEPSGTTDPALGSAWSQVQRIAMVPRVQPGMLRRKAGAFAHEIIRLQELGYSQSEIRQLLSDIGVHIAKSTVGREIERWRRQGQPMLPDPAAASPAPADLTPGQVEDFSKRLQTLAQELGAPPQSPPSPLPSPPWTGSNEVAQAQAPASSEQTPRGPTPPTSPGAVDAGSLVGDPRSGREIAAEFLRNHSANPLLNRKGKGHP